MIIIKAGLKSADLGSLSPQLFNFFPKDAISRLPADVFKSFTSNQLQNLNINQIQTIPNSLLTSLGGDKLTLLKNILFPFKTSG